MIPWIQVYSNLIAHPKTTKLADELKLSCNGVNVNVVAAGMLVSLWLWAAQNATDGDLQDCSDRAIAEASGYKKNPAAFVAALVKTRWIDEDRKIHDWDEHAALLIDADAQQKENTKERVRRYRERKKQNKKESVTPECNVTCNASNAPTLPNLTLPNLTVTNYDDAVDESTGARAADENELAEIGLKPGEYLNVTVGQVEDAKRTAQDLIARYAPHRCCTTADCRMVFWRFHRGDKDAVALLEYAFEAAALSGNAGNWQYINGILDRCALRDIRTVQAAREWDMERPDLYPEEQI